MKISLLDSWRFCRDEDPVVTREFPIEFMRDWAARRNLPNPEPGSNHLFSRPDYDDSW